MKLIWKILIVALITALAVAGAYIQRGYFAVGCEWILGAAIMVAFCSMQKRNKPAAKGELSR